MLPGSDMAHTHQHGEVDHGRAFAIGVALNLAFVVVGTVCGSMPDFIVPGLTGELVPPGKPAALGEAIVRALRDPERRRGMGREGRKRFASQFSAEVNIPKIEAILAEAAGRA